MSEAPTHLGRVSGAGRHARANPTVTRRADPALEAVRDAVHRRLFEMLAPDVPDAPTVNKLLELDRRDLRSTATAFLATSSPERESASAALAASKEELHNRLRTLLAAGGIVRRYLVDTADGIFSDGQLNLVEIHTGPTPENNFARFTFDHVFNRAFPAGGSSSITFDFTWRNESQRAVSADVHGYLVLDGTAVTLSEGGFIAITSSSLKLDAAMAIFDLSTNPPAELPAQDGDSTVALKLECEATGFVEPGCIDGQDIFRGFDLQHFGAVVPAGGQLGVQLSLALFWQIFNGGEVQADFATNPRRVLTPGVLVVATDLDPVTHP